MAKLALLSVFNKVGITDLAKSLVDAGWTLLSSGGTAAAISDAGLPVTDVADHTGSPIMLGHRVVTLHPKVHGGMLADREHPEHQADLEAHDLHKQIVDPVEKELLQQVMENCNQTQTKAAQRLGINRNTLYKKLLEHGLTKQNGKPPGGTQQAAQSPAQPTV